MDPFTILTEDSCQVWIYPYITIRSIIRVLSAALLCWQEWVLLDHISLFCTGRKSLISYSLGIWFFSKLISNDIRTFHIRYTFSFFFKDGNDQIITWHQTVFSDKASEPFAQVCFILCYKKNLRKRLSKLNLNRAISYAYLESSPFGRLYVKDLFIMFQRSLMQKKTLFILTKT